MKILKRYATRNRKPIYGSGGMKTKIEAAKICQFVGLLHGNSKWKFSKNPIKKIIERSKDVLGFCQRISKLDARKQLDSWFCCT